MMRLISLLLSITPVLPAALVSMTAGTAHSQILIFEDDFEDGIIDPDLWELYLPPGSNGTAVESGGSLRLDDRIWLQSASSLVGLDSDLIIEGEITAVGVGDSWHAWMYANQAPGGCCYFNEDGLDFAITFYGSEVTQIYPVGHVAGDVVTGPKPGGSAVGFRISTLAGVATLEAWDLADPSDDVVLQASFTKLAGAGHQLIFYNREDRGPLLLDNVRVYRNEADCNGNAEPDADDIANGSSPDCDGNGVPDECDLATNAEADCNVNGILDSCDIAAGLELDCNGNGVPDSCDLAAGTSLDCDANGIPDECDIASGASDCNADGIPDACQITSDASLDLNANGVLDSCEAIGINYCSPAIANSTGAPAAIFALGSEVLASSDLTMTVSGLPSNTFAMFVTSQTQGYAFPIPGSQGALCVAGFPGRFNRPGQIQSSGSSGTLVFPIDLTSLPTPIGFTAAQPGETWNFQAWYRDANPTVTSNFTDAVGITFQ